MDETPTPEQKNYSRNYFTPRNIIIYLIVAVLLYGAIYFLFLNKNTNQSNTSMTPQASPTMSMELSPTGAMEGMAPMTITLSEQNDSGETGTAVLTESAEGKTTVTLTMAGEPAGASQPAHIHTGACPKPGAVVYPLTNVVNGMSETTIDVTMAELMSQLPLAINVHKSATQSAVYMACGDLK